MSGAEVLAIASVASSVGQIVGGISQASSEKKVRDQNVAAEQQANSLNMVAADRQRAKILGSQTAAFASAGIDTNSGEALDLTQNTSEQSLLDKAITNFNSQSRQMQIYNAGNEKISAARKQSIAGFGNLLKSGAGAYDSFGGSNWINSNQSLGGAFDSSPTGPYKLLS